jgi:hypothetical protein
MNAAELTNDRVVEIPVASPGPPLRRENSMPDPAATDIPVDAVSSPVAEPLKARWPKKIDRPHSPLDRERTSQDLGASKTNRNGETRLAGGEKRDDLSREPQQPFGLKDVQVGNRDGRGSRITHIYAVQSDEYAIYQAGEVMVHFADDPGKAQVQRKSLLPVSSARAAINALVQGLACREVCDRQLAYALQLALDGDIDGAKETVAAAKAFALAKRSARGRFQYLKWSYCTAAVLIGLLFVSSRFYPFPEASSDLWLAAQAGLVGAAFSIALAIRGRTVALDTELLDNVTDGTLRLLIGVISAGVLLLLLACGILPGLKIGEANFSGAALTWQTVLVIGFVAGFLERLVPDLLEKRNPQGNGGNNPGVAGAHS